MRRRRKKKRRKKKDEKRGRKRYLQVIYPSKDSIPSRRQIAGHTTYGNRMLRVSGGDGQMDGDQQSQKLL
jgi:hypothetical protein